MDVLVDPWGRDVLDWAPATPRIALGLIFVDAGFGKWRRGIGGTGDWFAGLGTPFSQALARLVATVELVGSALLVVGLLTHSVATPLAATYVSKVKLAIGGAGPLPRRAAGVAGGASGFSRSREPAAPSDTVRAAAREEARRAAEPHRPAADAADDAR